MVSLLISNTARKNTENKARSQPNHDCGARRSRNVWRYTKIASSPGFNTIFLKSTFLAFEFSKKQYNELNLIIHARTKHGMFARGDLCLRTEKSLHVRIHCNENIVKIIYYTVLQFESANTSRSIRIVHSRRGGWEGIIIACNANLDTISNPFFTFIVLFFSSSVSSRRRTYQRGGAFSPPPGDRDPHHGFGSRKTGDHIFVMSVKYFFRSMMRS